MPGMSSSHRNHNHLHRLSTVYTFKRGYGRAHNGKGGGRLRRRIVRRREAAAWKRKN